MYNYTDIIMCVFVCLLPCICTYMSSNGLSSNHETTQSIMSR